mgnify:CR=1 FL=1
MPENAEKKQGKGKFQKGQSGNPKGKIKGTKNKATLAAEHLLKGELDNICRKLIEEALEGNIQAIKLVLDRVLPPKKDREIEIRFPKLQNSKDAIKAASTIVNAVCCAEITPAEGESLSKTVETFVKAVHTYDLEKRLSELETRVNE